jgi:hypothetical protein
VRKALIIALRGLGHDVLTAFEDGRANQGIPDEDVLNRAIALGRAVLTNDRNDYHQLHKANPAHCGIITYTNDKDVAALAGRIHAAITALPSLVGQLVKVTKRP